MRVLVETVGGIDIYFESLEETCLIDENWSDNEEMVKKTIESLDKGDVVMFCARISAKAGDIEFTEDKYLGMCIHEKEEDFYVKYKEDYYTDMRDTVLGHVRKEIPLIIDSLKQIEL